MMSSRVFRCCFQCPSWMYFCGVVVPFSSLNSLTRQKDWIYITEEFCKLETVTYRTKILIHSSCGIVISYITIISIRVKPSEAILMRSQWPCRAIHPTLFVAWGRTFIGMGVYVIIIMLIIKLCHNNFGYRSLGFHR